MCISWTIKCLNLHIYLLIAWILDFWLNVESNRKYTLLRYLCTINFWFVICTVNKLGIYSSILYKCCGLLSWYKTQHCNNAAYQFKIKHSIDKTLWLTNAISWPLSKRQISEMRPEILSFITETFWVKKIRFWIVTWVMVNGIYRYDNSDTLLKFSCSVRYSVWLCHNTVYVRRRRMLA